MAQLVARLVRNEKVGGSNPPSSTTGRHPIRMSVFCMPGRCCGGALLWRRWCSGRCVCFVGPGCSVCPWAAARPRAVRAASFARRVVSKPGQAPPPPMGTAAWPSTLAASGVLMVFEPAPAPPPPMSTAAWPSVPSGALHTGGIWRAGVWRTGPRHRPPALRPGPAAAHRHGARVSAWTVTVAFNGARANLVCDFRQVLFIAILRRLHFAVFECVSPTGWLFRKGDVMVGDTWRQFPRFYLCMSLVTRGAIYGCE